MLSGENINVEKATETHLGPQGLGDPDDRSLRRVEIEVLIPKKMREKAKAEKCKEEFTDFLNCAKENGVSMVLKCRKQNSIMKDCLTRWYRDKEFQNICTEEYLNERSYYRSTGLRKKENTIKV